MSERLYDYIVVGGGIAGVICCETLATRDSTKSVLMISASPVIKQQCNVVQITKHLEYFDVAEMPFTSIQERFPSITVIQAVVTRLLPTEKLVECEDETTYGYRYKLCICTGGRAKLIDESSKFVVGLRDTETAAQLAERLTNAKRVAIVGNGGISMELVYEIRNCSIVWIVRDDHLNHVFFDSASAKFIKSALEHRNEAKQQEARQRRRLKYKIDHSGTSSSSVNAAALGPEWIQRIELVGSDETGGLKMDVEYRSEVEKILTEAEVDEEVISSAGKWPCYLRLTTGKIVGCDFVISATGVIPNVEPFMKVPSKIRCYEGESGGIEVDDQMRTGEPDVYAAGDVCKANWKTAADWFQMRLWPQAKQMGYFAAVCMLAHTENSDENVLQPFCFELFEHVTYFCGFKVILLGRYNCQGLEKYELLYRLNEGEEFIKLVTVDGRIRGAVLIGEADVAETIENLMLSEIDVSPYGENLLNENLFDLADYFD